MSRRNLFAVVLIVLSFVVLIPGLTKPLLTLTAFVDFMGQRTEIFTETRSILQTVESLHESGNDFVAFLILLFSVLVPFFKGLALLAALPQRDPVRRHRWVRFVDRIAKWSMADVFVVGVYVAYLAAKATDNLDARAEPGFYWFAAYCLISLLSIQVLHVPAPAVAADGEAASPGAPE